MPGVGEISDFDFFILAIIARVNNIAFSQLQIAQFYKYKSYGDEPWRINNTPKDLSFKVQNEK